MAEETRKEIPIEDGNEEKEAAAAEETAGKVGEETAAEEQSKASGQDEAAEQTPESEEEKTDTKSEDEAQAEKESERYMRLMAEFQNFKRRAAREKSDIHAYANEKIIGELLPVLDNFERALSTESDDVEGYAKGMELIFEQLKTALEHAGLTVISAVGEEFDPNVHNAVMTDQSDEYDDGVVSKELQKGYKLNDKVIRPSMVAVVRK
ncbi:MAG: nucleotide exchange factor GrpE [Clostridiales bacterium]|nr:nucleotide exchange factor GrpE [Clostridiales bacterium]